MSEFGLWKSRLSVFCASVDVVASRSGMNISKGLTDGRRVFPIGRGSETAAEFCDVGPFPIIGPIGIHPVGTLPRRPIWRRTGSVS